MVKEYLPTSVGGETKVFPAKYDNDQAPNVDNGDLQSLTLQQRDDGFAPNDIIPSKTHNFFFYLSSKLVNLIQKYSIFNLFTPIEGGADAGKMPLLYRKAGVILVPKTDENQYFVARQKIDKGSVASPDVDFPTNEETRKKFKLLDLSKVVVQEDDIPADYVGDSIFVRGVGEMEWIPQYTIQAGRSLAWLKIIGDNLAYNGERNIGRTETAYNGDIEEVVIPAHYRSLRVGELIHAPRQTSGGSLKSSRIGSNQAFYNKAWAGLSLDDDTTALKTLPINKDTIGFVSYLLESKLAGMMACLSNSWSSKDANFLAGTFYPAPVALSFKDLVGFPYSTKAFERYAIYSSSSSGGGVVQVQYNYNPTDNLFFHFKIYRGRTPASNVLSLTGNEFIIFPPSFPFFLGGVGTDHFQEQETVDDVLKHHFYYLPTSPRETQNGSFFSKKKQTGQFIPNATSIPATSPPYGNYQGGLQGEATARINNKGLTGFLGITYMDVNALGSNNDRRVRMTAKDWDDNLMMTGYTYQSMEDKLRRGGYAFEPDIMNVYSGDPTTNPQYIAMPLWMHL